MAHGRIAVTESPKGIGDGTLPTHSALSLYLAVMASAFILYPGGVAIATKPWAWLNSTLNVDGGSEIAVAYLGLASSVL